MKPKQIFLIGLILFFCLPGLAFADCAPLGRMDHWVVREDGKVLFYSGNNLLATVDLQDCPVSFSSTINLLNESVCDGDELLVNGQRCTIISLTVP